MFPQHLHPTHEKTGFQTQDHFYAITKVAAILKRFKSIRKEPYLSVLSVPTVRASFPDGWTDNEDK